MSLMKSFIKTIVRSVKKNGTFTPLKTNYSGKFRPQEGYRADLDKNFYSKMESNCYRYLIECHPDLRLVEYQPHWFTEKDGLPVGFRYCPDFKVTTHAGNTYWIEVCPYLDYHHQYNIETMKKYRPDVKIFVIDRHVYARIKRKFRRRVKGWEN